MASEKRERCKTIKNRNKPTNPFRFSTNGWLAGWLVGKTMVRSNGEMQNGVNKTGGF